MKRMAETLHARKIERPSRARAVSITNSPVSNSSPFLKVSPNLQAIWAERGSDRGNEPVECPYGWGILSFEEACEKNNVSPVVGRFGTWVVTTYGLECLAYYYPIPVARLNQGTWLRHMTSKRWVVFEDFAEALEAAIWYHRQPSAVAKPERARGISRSNRKPLLPSLRFQILKRDGYRCQICGSRAVDNAVLHVDHRVPVARGGTNDWANLWTLCRECNAGKATRDL